ncbi:MAG: peptide transporter permease [Firmicutes bacterium]|nr:peptide transporter permease [Bacillota bacterium]
MLFIERRKRMLSYMLKRLAYMAVTLWVVITITFFLMHAIPGDPLSGLARELPAHTKANYYAKYGLDKSLGEQYFIYINNLLHGDLGESLKYPGRDVKGEILKYAPATARLGLQAVSIGFLLGSILGLAAAFKRNRWPDYLVTGAALLGVSVPSFVLAALLQYIFAVRNSWLPATGWGGFAFTILPSIALSTSVLAIFARVMRASALDVIGQDYIMTARAKGSGGLSFAFKHVARNAVLPSVTLLGPQIAGIITGSFVIENIFAIPGIGSNFVTSVFNRDYTMIMGMTVFYAVVYMAALLLVDIAYAVIDPRIRLYEPK